MRKKVLIIDDEVDLCLLMKLYFLRKNYGVFIAHTLSEGLKLRDEIKPDYLFIDYNLPDRRPRYKSDYVSNATMQIPYTPWAFKPNGILSWLTAFKDLILFLLEPHESKPGTACQRYY